MARDGSILILKTGEALAPVKAARGDFHQWIAKGMGVAEDHLTVASVYTGDPLPDPSSLTGVVVTGSPLMVTDREDWSEASAAWLAGIVEAVDAHKAACATAREEGWLFAEVLEPGRRLRKLSETLTAFVSDEVYAANDEGASQA